MKLFTLSILARIQATQTSLPVLPPQHDQIQSHLVTPHLRSKKIEKSILFRTKWTYGSLSTDHGERGKRNTDELLKRNQ